MTTPALFSTPSDHAKNVLKLLRDRHNVLVSGPPATGKSRLLAEVRHWFCQSPNPVFRANGPIAFPAHEHGLNLGEWLPSPERNDRKVFPITFHQGTKHRDFVSGLIPAATPGQLGFRVVYGTLLNAAEHAATPDGAALVEIDEINRGPAVSVFGNTMNAIESDKRRLPNGGAGPMTSYFPILKASGEIEVYSIPHHLYIVAAMNQADTSVEPLDVAFLRRFEPYSLVPDEQLLRQHLGQTAGAGRPLPEAPALAADVFEAMIRAWAKVNAMVDLARGSEFQIGHGLCMDFDPASIGNDVAKAQQTAARIWNRIYAHVSEVFFGDSRGMAAAIKADSTGSPFKLENAEFADTSVARLHGPSSIGPEGVYALLKSIAEAT